MNFKDYLNNNINNQKEINDTMSFYNNFSSMCNLYSNKKTNDKLLRAEGKYNSKICFIFKDEMHLNNCIKNLNKILSVYGISVWDVLILFENKFNDDNQNIQMLVDEIKIMNPMVVYIYDNNDLGKRIIDNCSKDTIVGFEIINVNNIENLIVNSSSAEIYDLFKFLITYNY